MGDMEARFKFDVLAIKYACFLIDELNKDYVEFLEWAKDTRYI